MDYRTGRTAGTLLSADFSSEVCSSRAASQSEHTQPINHIRINDKINPLLFTPEVFILENEANKRNSSENVQMMEQREGEEAHCQKI